MIYEQKCGCCDAKFTMMYSGKDHLEMHIAFKHEGLAAEEKSDINNLIVAVEKGNPYMAISMEEVPNIIKTLQEAYKEYQEVQKKLTKLGQLENFSKG